MKIKNYDPNQRYFIKINSYEEFIEIQKELFKFGITWHEGNTAINRYSDVKFIHINYNYRNTITFSCDKDFDNENIIEIKASWFFEIQEKKDVVELNGKKYYKEELEEALKHLNPIK